MANHIRVVAALLLVFVAQTPVQAQQSARPLSWTSIGPDGLGPIRDLAIHPTNPSTIFAASPGGGLWKSADAGATWGAIDSLHESIVTRVVFDPTNPETLYAIAQSPGSERSVVSDRFLKSVDGGGTWAVARFASANPWSVNVDGLALSSDGSTLLTNTNNGLLRSRDGGVSWTTMSEELFSDVAFLPGSSSDIVAVSGAHRWYAQYAYWSSDGGKTWRPSNGSTNTGDHGGCRGQLATSLSAASIVYAADTCGHVYKSVNRGRSYAWLGTLPIRPDALWVDPNDSDHVLALSSEIWRTTDGGETWMPVAVPSAWPRSLAPTYYAVLADPGYGATNRRLYFATSVGVYKIDDLAAVTDGSGGGFVGLNTGLRVSRLSHAALDTRTGKIAATLDGGTALLDPLGGATVWFGPVGDPGGTVVAVDARSPGYAYSQQAYSIQRTNLTAGSTEYVDGRTQGGCKPEPYSIRDNGNDCGLARWPGPLTLDPNNPDTLLVGGRRLWRTTDAATANTPTMGPAWSALNEARGNAAIKRIAVAPGDANVIWLAYDSPMEVVATLNGTSAHPVWTSVALPPTRLRSVTNIVFDPDDARTVYLSFDAVSYISGAGYSLETDNIWKTGDGGQTWVNASGTGTAQLPSESVLALAVHPLANNVLYAGTSSGVYGSTDGGMTWSAVSPATVQVNELLWQRTGLIAATYGRGLFTAETRHALISLDRPRNLRTLAQPFALAGWSIDQASQTGAGISEVTVTAHPESGGTPIALGAAAYGGRRDDVASAFGAQFADSAFSMTISGLPPGRYRFVMSARSATTGQYEATRSLTLTLVTPVPGPRGAIGVPAPGATVGPRFHVSGWAIESGATMNAGVDAVHVYAYPTAGGFPVFLGVASYGGERADVAAIYGEQFLNSAFDLATGGLPEGNYRIVVFYRSALTHEFAAMTQDVAVRAPGDPRIFIDTPQEAAVVPPSFAIEGWALDRDAPAGTGIDAVHVYAFPSSGSTATFLGIGAQGVVRPDVGAAFGAQFTNAGYSLAATLPAGAYTVVVYARSTVTGRFSAAAHTITVQAQNAVAPTRASTAGETPSASAASWRSVGPTSFGGPVSFISPDPAKPNVLVIGTLSGVWRTADGGSTWGRVNERLGSVRALARHPIQSNVLLAAGTRSGYVYRSTDGGQTWSPLVANAPMDVVQLEFNADGTRLAAISGGDLYVSTDLGGSWTEDKSPLLYGGSIYAISFSRTDPDRWSVRYTFFTNYVWPSLVLTTDGGRTYSTVGTSGGDYKITWSRSDPSIAYALRYGQVRRSTDGGTTFSSMSVLPVDSAGPLWVDLDDSQRVWVAGRRREVWRSNDGGRTFTRISLAASGAPSGPILTMVEAPGFDATANRRVYFGTASGVFRTDDIRAVSATSTWTALNNGLEIASLASATASVNAGAIVAVTVNDEVWRYDVRTSTWARSYEPSLDVSPDALNGRRAVWDPIDPTRVYAASERSELLRSTDGGRSFEVLPGPYGDCLDYCTPSYAPSLALAKSDQRMLLLRGADRLVGTADVRAERPGWFTVQPWSAKSIPAPYAVSIDPTNADAVWVAGFAGGSAINRTSSGPRTAPTWPVVNATYATRLVFDPHDARTVYALPSLACTRDNGATWTAPSASPVGSATIFDLAIHPLDSNWMFLATDRGVYESRDGGTTWDVSYADVSVSELVWYGRTLIAATRGRGLIANDLSGDAFDRQITAIVTPADAEAGPTPVRIAGWAADLDAAAGAGIDAVHVWAFPALGVPRFVGVASLGHPNADAATLYGARFVDSGFELVNDDLPVGRYTIVAYARSAATGIFKGSRGVAYTVTGRGAPAMALDAPAPGAAVSGRVLVQGWALDGRASTGTGVDAVHVWAFPTGGGAPVFVGIPAAQTRPDVAQVYGTRFLSAGFAASFDPLPTGTYDLVVFARSTVTGHFDQARAVRVSASQ